MARNMGTILMMPASIKSAGELATLLRTPMAKKPQNINIMSMKVMAKVVNMAIMVFVLCVVIC